MADEAPELRQDRREGSELTEETDGSGQVPEGSDPAPLFLRGAGKPAAGARGRGDQDASKHQAACHRHPYACKGASTDRTAPAKRKPAPVRAYPAMVDPTWLPIQRARAMLESTRPRPASAPPIKRTAR
jgi:hypothetical protein